MHRTAVVLCLLVWQLTIAPHLFAQGFNATNGRNHPELRWQVAETEHFQIMYPARLAGIEVQAAPIAEATYTALSGNLGVSFDEKIRIYLSDEDEITNGFAVPIGSGYTNIWVHQNEGMAIWTGRDKWLRKVLAHELTHIFHYRAVLTGSPRLLQFLLGDPLPRFWTEGLAQYETERWDAQRGDRWLRTAVLDDQLSYEDGRSIWNGRLLYAIGNAQVRRFADQYGDSTLARLLHHRSSRLFGMARVHDFNAAFEDVTGRSYRDYYDDWRRFVNVYYNTLVGQLETTDSLVTDSSRVEVLELPGQYLYEAVFSPDTTRIAVLSLASLQRPVLRLSVVDRASREARVVAEGSIHAQVSWSPDGRRLAYSRATRGRHGSILNDLYVVDADGRHRRRLTYSRRASSPSFSPDGDRIAFAGSSGGTANVFVLDVETGVEEQLTTFDGDNQIADITWHPSADTVAFARFAPDGSRRIMLLDVRTRALRAVTDGAHDDRTPVWSPDGSRLAYASLRDDVPNVFVYDQASHTHRRVTRLVTGATPHDWLPPDSAHAAGRLLVVSNVSKSHDEAFTIDASRTVPAPSATLPAGFAAWTTHRPPHEVPGRIPPDPSLITDRYAYCAWSNLTHATTFGVPYFAGPSDWGLAGATAWIEPLGKHGLYVAGALSLPDPGANSFLVGSYVNNQWYPTVSLNLYRFPGSARFYGGDVLVENFAGGDVSATWPLDWTDRPYVADRVGVRVRYIDVRPLDAARFGDLPDLPRPEAGRQADLAVAYTRKKQRPYRYNIIHPLDGLGLRVQLTGALPVLGADSRFLRGDMKAFGVFRSAGLQRIYLYGRLQAQVGQARAQDYLGFTRIDGVQIALPGVTPFSFSGLDRVRGYRAYALGNRVAFGTLEYRVPLLSDLQTRLLGLVSLGATTLAAFADAGAVWTGGRIEDAERRLGVGVEVKNALRIGGFFEIAHAVGLAQPAVNVGTTASYDVYYRVRAAVPF